MSRSQPRERRGEAGFTIIEGMIAALILAIVLIGILPLVDRSMQNNVQGNDATNESNATTDGIEQLLSLPFNSPRLTLTTGAASLVATDYMARDTAHGDATYWSTVDPGAGNRIYRRQVTVEQFSGPDLTSDSKFDSPRPGGSPVGEIQFKRITTVLERARTLGESTYQVVAVKSQ